MAIWQYSLHFLPRLAVLERYSQIPLTISQNDFDDEEWWQSATQRDDPRPAFDGIVKRATSWSTSIWMWGDEDGDRVHIGHTEGRIEDISIRVDVRTISFLFVNNIVSTARHLDCLLLTEGRYLLTPSVPKLLTRITKSPSFRFVSDPQSFLAQLSDVETSNTHDE